MLVEGTFSRSSTELDVEPGMSFGPTLVSVPEEMGGLVWRKDEMSWATLAGRMTSTEDNIYRTRTGGT